MKSYGSQRRQPNRLGSGVLAEPTIPSTAHVALGQPADRLIQSATADRLDFRTERLGLGCPA